MLRGVRFSERNLNHPKHSTSSRETGLPTCSARPVKFAKKTQEIFRACAKSQFKNRVFVLEYSNGNAAVDPASQSAVISDCFATAYRYDNGYRPPLIYKESIPMEFVQISSVAVENSFFHSMNMGLHPKFPTILASFIATSAYDCRTVGYFVPIFKKGAGKFREITVM